MTSDFEIVWNGTKPYGYLCVSIAPEEMPQAPPRLEAFRERLSRAPVLLDLFRQFGPMTIQQLHSRLPSNQRLALRRTDPLYVAVDALRRRGKLVAGERTKRGVLYSLPPVSPTSDTPDRTCSPQNSSGSSRNT